MIASEAAQVLTVAAAYDGRTVTEEASIAWADALQRIRLEDALNAVKVHYRTNRRWMMPADVVEAAAKAQEQRELEASRNQVINERICRTPGCACTHTSCFKGWIDEDIVTVRNGQTYISAERCPKCHDYAVANASDKRDGLTR